MARLELRADLTALVTTRMVRPAVDRILGDIAEDARRLAPDGKYWQTMEDERVRPSHRAAHGQTVPENVRYRLDKMAYIRKGRGPDGRAINPGGGWRIIRGFGWDLADAPRDPALPPEQREQCRCESVRLPGAVARSIRTTQARVEGARVTGQVYSRFPRVAEAEVGDGGRPGARFMRQALETAAARYGRRR